MGSRRSGHWVVMGRATPMSVWERLASTCVIAACCVGSMGRVVRGAPAAQGPIVAWSEPRVVWESGGRTSGPILVTDAWGKVHLFFLNQEEGEASNTLYHANPEDLDAQPVDVMLGINEYRVAADTYGRLHVLALGAANSVTFASAMSAEAGNAGAWSQPEALGTASLGIDITADSKGGLHVCYPHDHSVVYQRSDDGGATWAEPVRAGDMLDSTGAGTYVRCAVDDTGTVHMAWAEARPPNYYPPDGVFYARSTDGGTSWSAAEEIAGAQHSLPALLADPTGTVHLFWHGAAGVGGRYYRRRPAGAAGDWGPTETVVPAGRGGMSGDAFLALDSRNTLHVGMNVDGIYWASRDSEWRAPIELSAVQGDLPNASRSIEQATLAIANGNEIHVAWEFDFKRIYVLTGQTDAPAVVPTPWPLPRVQADDATPRAARSRPTPSPDSASAAAATASITASVLSAEALAAGRTVDRGHLPVMLGLTFSLAVVGWVVLRRWRDVQR